MTLLGSFLLAVGLCDLLRAARDPTSVRRRVALVVTGLVLLAVLGAVLGLSTRAWLTGGPLAGGGLVGWILASAYALDPDGGSPRSVAWARSAAFTALAVPILLLFLLGGAASTHPITAGWLSGSQLDRLGVERALVWAGALVLQLASANVVVRLLLDAIGVLEVDTEKQLRGGRLLGPLERVLLVLLGTAGYPSAAAVVVAAKGLLRFPDLTRDRPGAPTDLSEYFLVGSLTSWLLAVGGTAVLIVGRG